MTGDDRQAKYNELVATAGESFPGGIQGDDLVSVTDALKQVETKLDAEIEPLRQLVKDMKAQVAEGSNCEQEKVETPFALCTRDGDERTDSKGAWCCCRSYGLSSVSKAQKCDLVNVQSSSTRSALAPSMIALCLGAFAATALVGTR